ncbi:hypothetical protein LRK24_15975 [Rhodanobacter denitrificans]|nr:hypothetical protein [Rhodanobacter denitrificans]UJM89915.1 hypothetical protein LRK24_15975 [Rhodanobacter denitrificans]
MLLLVAGFAAVALDHGAVQIIGGLDQRGAHRLAGRGLLRVGEVAADAADVAAQVDAAAGAAPFDGARIHHFRGLRVDHPQVDRDIGLRLAAAHAEAGDVEAAAGVGGVLGVRHDAAGDRVLRAGDVAGVRAAAWAHARAGGKVLLGQHGVDLLPLDHLEIAGGTQLVAEHVGKLPADVAVPPVGGAGVVGEVDHGDGHGRRLARHRDACAQGQGRARHACTVHGFHELPSSR